MGASGVRRKISKKMNEGLNVEFSGYVIGEKSNVIIRNGDLLNQTLTLPFVT